MNENIGEAFKCIFEEELLKDRLKCTTCTRDYAVYARKHTCNQTIRCGDTRTKFEERYLPDLSLDENVLVVECEKCEAERKELMTPRKCTCPECNYNGWYVHGEDKLCPACKVPKIIQENKIVKVAMVSNVELPKSTMVLMPIIRTTGKSPESGSCTYIFVGGVTVESANKENWFEVEWECDMHSPLGRDDNSVYVHAMQDLNNFLITVSAEYNFSWKFASGSFDSLWLQYLYTHFCPKKDFSLSFI